MKILLVGKTGVFDALAVAAGYLDQMEIYNSPNFADINLENSKKLVKAGADGRGNELFVVGHNAPEVVPIVNQEFETLSKINENERIQVIPIKVAGENTTWVLSKLANLSLVGKLFLQWAKRRTLNRSYYLWEQGKNLHIETHLMDKTDILAAKPFGNNRKE